MNKERNYIMIKSTVPQGDMAIISMYTSYTSDLQNT